MNVKRLIPAIVIVFANLIGATIILPILPLFAVDQLGGTVFRLFCWIQHTMHQNLSLRRS
jgi:hypothetical protein